MRERLGAVATVAVFVIVGCGGGGGGDGGGGDAGPPPSPPDDMAPAPGGPAPGEDGGPAPSGPSGPEHTALAQPVAVPLTPVDRHLVAVEATIDGEGPFQLVVDTGSAAMLRVSPQLADALGLEQIGTMPSGDPSGENTEEVPIVAVNSVQIGDAELQGVEATVGTRLGGLEPDGIVGLSLFSGLTATLDYPGQELRLTRQPLDPAAHVVPFTSEQGVPQIQVEAAGVTLQADVDSGGPAILTIPSSVELPFTGEPQVVGRGRTATGEFDIRAADLDGDLNVAGWTIPGPRVDIVDVLPVASIGADLLRNYEVTFDLVANRLALLPEDGE